MVVGSFFMVQGVEVVGALGSSVVSAVLPVVVATASGAFASAERLPAG